MNTLDFEKTAELHDDDIAPRRPDRSIWLEALMRRIGKMVLAVCPRKKGPCMNLHCALRPFCSCAMANLKAARKFENRVWLALASCGALALIIALWRASIDP